MRVKIIYLLIAFLILETGYSQKVTIEYLYKPTEYMRDSFDFGLRLCNLYAIRDTRRIQTLQPIVQKFNCENDYSKTVFTFLINDTMPILIGESFGHQIMLLPEDDTVRITLRKQIENPPYFSKDSFLIPWTNEYEYQSQKNKVLQIYDSIDMAVGSPFWDKVQLKKTDYDYGKFYNLCLKKYLKRIDFINRYFENHQIPNSFKSLILEEVKCGFIINLLFIFKQSFIPPDILEILPQKLKNSLDSFEINDERFFRKTNLYAKAVSDYFYLYMPYLHKKFDSNDLITMYDMAKNYSEGEVRNFLIRNHLKFYLKEPSYVYDSLLLDLKTFSSDTNSLVYLDSARNHFKLEQKIPFAEILATEVVNIEGQKIPLDKIIENKPTIIDCWASWCKPCIQEIPAAKKIANKFKGKIAYIYLSVDENKTAWFKRAEQFKLEKSYLLINNSNNKFSSYFDITTIPRYIILDKNKKLFAVNAPRPSDVAALEKMLEELLK